MGVGRGTRILGAVVAAFALFPAQTGLAQLPSTPPLPQAPNLPPIPNLPPTPNLPPAPVEVPSTPSLPAPDVSVPDLQTPKLPISPPSTPNLPSSGVTDAVPAPGSSAGQSSSPSSPGGQASVQGQPSAAGPAGSTAGRSRGSAGRRGQSVAPPRTPGQQRLEHVVRRRSACLPGLPSAQRRVVVLRSGFGPGGPRARSAVAQMLDTGVRRVARLEQRAIAALGTDGPGGACSTAPGLVAIASGGLLDLLGLGKGLGDGGGGPDDPATQGEAQVAGQSETSAAAQSSDSPSVQLPLGLPAASPADLAGLTVIVVVLCFAGGFFVSGTWKELSSRRTAQHH